MGTRTQKKVQLKTILEMEWHILYLKAFIDRGYGNENALIKDVSKAIPDVLHFENRAIERVIESIVQDGYKYSTEQGGHSHNQFMDLAELIINSKVLGDMSDGNYHIVFSFPTNEANQKVIG